MTCVPGLLTGPYEASSCARNWTLAPSVQLEFATEGGVQW